MPATFDSNPLKPPRDVPILDALPVDALPMAVPVGGVAVLDAIVIEEPLTALPALEALPVRRPMPVPRPPAQDTRGPVARAFGFFGWLMWTISSGLEWLFGAATLMVGLAVLAALPILQFLSLGYLLEAGARVARSGRLRDGFIGVRLAARLGCAVLGSYLLLLPVRVLSGFAHAAHVIDPGGRVAQGWRAALLVLIALTALHLGAACARGGKFRYFLWPFNVIWLFRRLLRGGYYTETRDAVWDMTMSLRLPYYFWLGLRGFIGAFVWLLLPVTLIALGRGHFPVAPLLGFLGALLLGLVLLYLPFLQLRLAEVNRLKAVFNLRTVRADFGRAPWACAVALVVTLLFALPLYLLKIEFIPREAAWLPSLVFISFIFPARLLTGWAVGRARRREAPRHWFFRWTARLPLLPAAAFYVLIVYFTQFTSWNGVWSLYEQHAFLLPVPFFGG